MKNKKSNGGFTLIELLVAIALTSIVLGLIMPLKGIPLAIKIAVPVAGTVGLLAWPYLEEVWHKVSKVLGRGFQFIKDYSVAFIGFALIALSWAVFMPYVHPGDANHLIQIHQSELLKGLTFLMAGVIILHFELFLTCIFQEHGRYIGAGILGVAAVTAAINVHPVLAVISGLGALWLGLSKVQLFRVTTWTTWTASWRKPQVVGDVDFDYPDDIEIPVVAKVESPVPLFGEEHHDLSAVSEKINLSPLG